MSVSIAVDPPLCFNHNPFIEEMERGRAVQIFLIKILEQEERIAAVPETLLDTFPHRYKVVLILPVCVAVGTTLLFAGDNAAVRSTGIGLIALGLIPICAYLISSKSIRVYRRYGLISEMEKAKRTLGETAEELRRKKDRRLHSKELIKIFQNDELSFELRQEIASELSSRQLITVYDRCGQSLFESLICESDHIFLSSIRNPAGNAAQVLNDYRDDFQTDAWLLDYFLKRLDRFVLAEEQVKKALVEIVGETALKEMLGRTVEIDSGEERTVVDSEKLEQFPFFRKSSFMKSELSEEGRHVLFFSQPSDEVGGNRMLHAVLDYIERNVLPEDPDYLELIIAADFYGVQPLVMHCAKKILTEMECEGTSNNMEIFNAVLLYSANDSSVRSYVSNRLKKFDRDHLLVKYGHLPGLREMLES